MTLSQTEIQSQVIELSTEAFKAFCNDICGMFGMDAECRQQEAVTETVKGLRKRFKKLAAVNSVKAEGALEGAFQLVFDREGLFTLAGVTFKLPDEEISENRIRGSAKDAEAMSDAVVEVGNLLVGSWERVFREELDGHGCFVQSDTFIGNPWDKPDKKIGLASDEEFVFVPYEMTIRPYTTFNCGVIFPKTIFENRFDAAPEQADGDEEKKQKKTQDQKADVEKLSEKTATKEDAKEIIEADIAAANKKVKSAKKKPAAKKAKGKNKAAAQREPKAAVKEKDKEVPIDAPDSGVKGKTEATDEKNSNNEQPISKTIRKMSESPATLPGEQAPLPMAENPAHISTSVSLAICAKDIMQKDIVWAGPDDSVEQALSKIQQHNAGYMMVGRDGIPEGFISKSDLTAAISPYLRPAFAKWHRQLDDATLQIRVKWIMRKPVYTIRPETPLAVIMENMLQLRNRCLPVADKKGKVHGLVTAFDIFNTLLNNGATT